MFKAETYSYVNCPDATSISPRLYFFCEIRNKRHNFENSYFLRKRTKQLRYILHRTDLLKRKHIFPNSWHFLTVRTAGLSHFGPIWEWHIFLTIIYIYILSCASILAIIAHQVRHPLFEYIYIIMDVRLCIIFCMIFAYY